MDNYYNIPKEFTWVNNGKTASTDISGLGKNKPVTTLTICLS